MRTAGLPIAAIPYNSLKTALEQVSIAAIDGNALGGGGAYMSSECTACIGPRSSNHSDIG